MSVEKIEALEKLDWWIWETETFTWEERFAQCVNVYKKLNKLPSVLSKVDIEKQVASWICNQRQACKNGKLSVKNIDTLNELDWWIWETDTFTWEERLELFVNVYNKLNKLPSPSSKDDEESRAAIWMHNQRQNYKNGTLSVNNIETLEELDWWIWERKTTWEDRFAQCVIVYNKLNKLPTSSSKDYDEKQAGSWIGDQRKAYKKGKLSVKNIEKLEELDWWIWETERFTWDEKLEQCLDV